MLKPAVDDLDHKPQKHRLPLLCFIAFCIIAPILAAAGYFRSPAKYFFFISLNTFGMCVLIAFGWIASGLSKSMAETGEIDALAWLLKTTPTQNPALFKKASRIASSSDYRSRLLESLMPLLSSLITLHHTTHKPGDPFENDLETYVSCLADLSNFTDEKGSICRLWENAKQHPKLEEPLREILKTLADDIRGARRLGSAAADVLHNFSLNGQGEEPMDSTTSLVELQPRCKNKYRDDV